jgi:lipoprotein signal peptidase
MQATRGTALTGSQADRQESAQPANPANGAGPAAPRPRSRVGVLLIVAAIVLAADAISKVIVVATLSGRQCLNGPVVPQPPPIRLLGGLLTLCESRNPGAAFSIGGPSETILYSAIAIGVIVFILRTARRIRSLPWAVTLGLLLGGATGNLTDRLLRYPGPFRGWVVDWIQLPHWPVFNLADSAIVCGGVLAVLLALRGIGIDGSRAGRDAGRKA